MDEALRRKLCRLVAGIVVTDDDLDPSEDQFIDHLLKGYGFPPGDRDTIFPIIDASEAAAEIEGLPDDAKQEALRLLLDAACADGKVVDEERVFLRVVGKAMGKDAAETDRLIAERLART